MKKPKESQKDIMDYQSRKVTYEFHQHHDHHTKQYLKLSNKQEVKCLAMLQIKNVRNDVVIQQNKWREHHFGLFFDNKKLKTLNIYGGFILNNNQEPRILKQISHTKFQSLIRLYLPGNKIQSIQVLSRLQMPDIKKLWLGDNQICELSSLRKCRFTNLSRLIIHNNPMKELKLLSEFGAPSLMSVSVEFNGQETLINGLSWSVQVESRKLKQIDIGGSSSQKFRDHYLRLIKKLKAKYKQKISVIISEEISDGDSEENSQS